MSYVVNQSESLDWVDVRRSSVRPIIHRSATVGDGLTTIEPRRLTSVALTHKREGQLFEMTTRAQLLAVIESLQAAYDATADTPDEDETATRELVGEDDLSW